MRPIDKKNLFYCHSVIASLIPIPGKRNPPGYCGQNGVFSNDLSGAEGEVNLLCVLMTVGGGIKVMREAGKSLCVP